ncbi:hypothetical protein [Bacteroides clarus]|uniref:hypothetical protein n=1 Tax=Bacteroides clarus TaxID=626929 RepID=UPI0018ABCB6A|nr:hypothetical protein [Bacteroides clarus]
MNLNELRDRAYKTACDHGFHDEELSNEHCLCLVISELMEAVEADRKGKRFNKDAKETYELIQNVKFCKVIYKNYIKGSVEEELADAVIRLLDLSGLRNIHLELVTKDIGDSIDEIAEYYKDDTFTEAIYHISTLPVIYAGLCGYNTAINETILSIFGLAKHLDIDLIWHVEQKMCYNELRESKHGKKY